MFGKLCSLAVAVAVGLGASGRETGPYSIKVGTTPPPEELREPFRKLLEERSVQLVDEKGTVLAELWFRKTIPARATPEQVKNGLTYREVEESTFLGAVKFEQPYSDYRKQKIKAGVYTLRLGFQPMDGDHMGTAPYNEFCLLIPARFDAKPDLMDVKELREQSNKAPAANHPGVMLLFPNEQPQDPPTLVAREGDHWVLNWKAEAVADGQKTVLGLGLVLIGHSVAE